MDPLSPSSGDADSTSGVGVGSGSGSGASKRKRPSRILTPATPHANAQAHGHKDETADAGDAPLLPAPAMHSRADAVDASIPLADHESRRRSESLSESERGCKLSRVDGGGGDISSGSPVVLGARCGSDNILSTRGGNGGGRSGANGGDESAATRGPLPLHPTTTPRSTGPDPALSPDRVALPPLHMAHSPASSARSEAPHSQTVLAALSARTHDHSVSVSAASSAWNTPASSALRDVSLLSTPSWSPAGAGDVSALPTSRHPLHSAGARPLPAYSFSDRAIAAAAVAAALASSAANPAVCPSTPPSNVASPSASPRRVPDSDPAVDPDAYALDPDGHSDASLPLNLTVNTSSSFLARQRSQHAASRSHAATSPSSSPALSPTSTASQLRPVPSVSLPNLRLNLCPSPPCSVAGLSVNMSPLTSPSRAGQLQAHAPPLPLTLSPRCPQHTHVAAALSPARQTSSGSASHASSPRQPHSVPGSGSGGGGARSPSPARSPGRSPSHTWSKPLFLSRLHVNIPEVSPLISSPIPLAETPSATAAAAAAAAASTGSGLGPRPSPAQALRDREREQRVGPSIPPVPEEDGVVSCGPHYAVSLLKGRRRKMEDAFMQAAIDPQQDGADVTAAAAADADEEDVTVELPPSPPSPLANLFGIADGHGKSGALVAQLTSQLLPQLFQQNLRQALQEAQAGAGVSAELKPDSEEKTALASHTLMSPRGAVPPQAQQPVRGESILQSPLPSLLPPRPFSGHGSPIVQMVSPSPPLSASSTMALPVLTLSPAVAAAATPARPPPSPLVTPAPTSALGSAGVACEDDLSALAAFRLDGSAAASDPVCVALQRAFLQVDEKILAGKHSGGSTCTTAYVHQPPPASSADSSTSNASLYVASVGDSRCVLSRSGRAIALSVDHKPCRPDERLRVEKAGGQVVFYSGWRVDGVLNISRAIGDAHLKDPSNPTSGRVIALPEVARIAIDDDDEFVIVASDGVWSKVSNQAAIDIVRRVLLEGEEGEGGEDVAAAPAVSEEDALPPVSRPALAFDNSYLQPSSSCAQPHASNPIQTPRLPPAGYNRVDSNDTVHSHHPMELSSAAVSLAVPTLDSKGSMVSTAASALTILTPLSSPPPLHPTSASSSSFRTTPLPSPHAAMRSTMSSSASVLSRNSSTRLTSPTGGLTLAHRDSVRTLALPSPSMAPRLSPSAADGHTLSAAAAATATAPPPAFMSVGDGSSSTADTPAPVVASSASVPCCWSSLHRHPDRVAAASEALVRHAFDEANSMDNISVAVVLLYPFQHNDTANDCKDQQQA